MGLGDKNLSAGFMNQGYGRPSSSDERELIRMRASSGGKAPIEDIYNRTGNMRVANTLAHYQQGGRRYQEGGWMNLNPTNPQVPETSAGDPYSYQYNAANDQYRFKRTADQSDWEIADVGSENYIGMQKRFNQTPTAANPQVITPDAEETITMDDVQLDADIMAGVDDNAAGPIITEETPPEVDPSWWDKNQRGLGRGASNVAAGLLNIAPNIANMKAYNNMQGVRPSNLQKTVTSKAPSMEASRQAVIAQGRNAAQRAQGMSPQDQLAASAQAMAGTQSALSRLGGQQAQVQAQTDARNAAAQNRTSAQNQSTLNRELQQQQSRDMMQLRGLAQERGAIGTKSLGFLGDLNRQKLDREKMDLTRQRYDMDDQMKRAQLDYFNKHGYLPEFATQPDNE